MRARKSDGEADWNADGGKPQRKREGEKADTDRGSGERGMREIKSALRFDMAV